MTLKAKISRTETDFQIAIYENEEYAFQCRCARIDKSFRGESYMGKGIDGFVSICLTPGFIDVEIEPDVVLGETHWKWAGV